MPATSRWCRVKTDPATGLHRSGRSQAKVSARTAAVYFETPSYLGMFEANGAAIAELAQPHGAETIVGVDPLSLGIVKPPADFGADIVVGPTQPLGVHMNCGGGVGGYIATRDEERLCARVQWLPRQHHRNREDRASSASASPARIRLPTACARRARTGPATRSISGPSPMRSTCRCSARKAWRARRD